MDKEVTKYYKACTYAYYRASMLSTYQDPEDFALYCFEHEFSKPFKWMFIDFLRLTVGRVNSDGYATRLSLGRPSSLNVRVDNMPVDWIDQIVDTEGEKRAGVLVTHGRILTFIQSQDIRTQKVLVYYLLGYTQREIAETLRLTPSRISQILDRLPSDKA